MLTSFDKAIAAFLGALVTLLATFGLELPAFFKDPATQMALASVVAGILTYVVPNKE